MEKFEHDIRIVAKAKNNALLTMREWLGFSQIKMAKEVGISFQTYHRYETLKISPFMKNGKMRSTTEKIMAYFHVPFSWIWTEGIINIKKTSMEQEISSINYLDIVEVDSIEALPSASMSEEIERDYDLDRMISTLSPREEKVIREYFFNDKTTAEIAEDFNLTVGGISVIKLRALRKLRHPTRGKPLKGELNKENIDNIINDMVRKYNDESKIRDTQRF